MTTPAKTSLAELRKLRIQMNAEMERDRRIGYYVDPAMYAIRYAPVAAALEGRDLFALSALPDKPTKGKKR